MLKNIYFLILLASTPLFSEKPVYIPAMEPVEIDIDKARTFCKRDNALACTDMGLYYLVRNKKTKGERFLGDACDDGAVDACYFLGMLHKYSFEKPQIQEAMKYFKIACEGDMYAGCFELEVIYRDLGENHEADTYSKRACSEETPVRCRNLAELYQIESLPWKDINKSKFFFEKACFSDNHYSCNQLFHIYGKQGVAQKLHFEKEFCNKGSAYSCLTLANDYRQGDDTDKNITQALTYYNKACDLNNSEACRELAAMYYVGNSVEKNIPKEIFYLRKACDLNESASCYVLGLAEQKRKDKNKGVEYFKKACDLNNSDGCLSLGYKITEHNTTQNFIQAEKYFIKACKLNNAEGCLDVGLLFTDETALPMDIKKADKFLLKACELKNGEACFRLGYGAAQNKKEAEAMQWYRKACEMKYPRGCLYLGVHYAAQKDYHHAAEKMEKACQLGNLKGCFYAGHAYQHAEGVSLDYTKAKTLLEKACQGEYGGGCVQLGQLYIKGKGVPKDSDKALKLFLHGCDLNVSTGCYNAAGVYIKYKKKTQPAMPLLKKACSLKDKDACQLFETISKHTKRLNPKATLR